MKEFTVYVYNNHTGAHAGLNTCKNKPLAYTRFYQREACVHKVIAEDRSQAKRNAIRQHLEDLACSQLDPYCDLCEMKRKREPKKTCEHCSINSR